MAHLRSIPLLAALTTLSAFSPSAHASFPAGVWGLVDEVTTIVEPGMTEPTMVRIDGLFMVAGHKPDFAQYPGYGEPQSGYMYYKCSEKELATCVMEWKELQAIAGGADNCRGWGDNSLPDNGKVYAGPQLPLVPDLYPLGMGVVKGFGPCEALKAWQMEFPGTTTGDETSTSTSTSTSTTTDATGGTADTATSVDATGGDTDGPGTSAGETASTHSTHTSDVTGGDQTGTVATEGGTAGPTEGGTSTGGTTAASAADASGGAETGAADDDKGCACNSAADPARELPAALLTLLGLGLLGRRRA
jgi:MYXO-CTERM domain-containing protein